MTRSETRAPIWTCTARPEKNPRRARRAGRGALRGVGTYQLRDVIVSRGGERLRDLRGEGRGAGWVSEPPGLAGKNEVDGRFVHAEATWKRSSGHAPPRRPRRTPGRSARRLSCAARGRAAACAPRAETRRRVHRTTPLLCVGLPSRAVPSFTPRNSRAHTTATPKRSKPRNAENRFFASYYLVTKKQIIIFPENSNSRLKQLALHPRGLHSKTRAGVVRRRRPDTMETQKKTSPLKDIKSFFSPNGAGAGAPNSGAAKAKAIPSEAAMPNKLDFAATARAVAGPERAPSSSEPAAEAYDPREALATVANGVAGAANPAANRRDSISPRPPSSRAIGNSPAPSVGFTTPAHGLRAAHAGPDPADTPLAIDADAVRRAIPPRRAATSTHREAIAHGVPRFDVSTIRRLDQRVLDATTFVRERALSSASLDRRSHRRAPP